MWQMTGVLYLRGEQLEVSFDMSANYLYIFLIFGLPHMVISNKGLAFKVAVEAVFNLLRITLYPISTNNRW